MILTITDSIPGVGGGGDEDSGETKEEQEEQERLRQEAIKQAEIERRTKYKKQEEERESMRQTIREKVYWCQWYSNTLSPFATFCNENSWMCSFVNMMFKQFYIS